jgi:hypothetical protein
VFGLLNKPRNGLNQLIRDFDNAFNYQLNENASKLITSRNRNLLNNIIDTLDIRFQSDHDFFKRHKHFRYARLEMLASRNREQNLIQKYFSNYPVQFSMPAYWISFKDVFSGFGRQLLKKPTLSNPLNHPSSTVSGPTAGDKSPKF